MQNLKKKKEVKLIDPLRDLKMALGDVTINKADKICAICLGVHFNEKRTVKTLICNLFRPMRGLETKCFLKILLWHIR